MGWSEYQRFQNRPRYADGDIQDLTVLQETMAPEFNRMWNPRTNADRPQRGRSVTRAGRAFRPAPAPLRRVRGDAHGLGGPRDARYRARSRKPGAARVRGEQSNDPRRAARYDELVHGTGLSMDISTAGLKMANVVEYLMEAFYREPENDIAYQNTLTRLYENIERHWLSPPNACGLWPLR